MSDDEFINKMPREWDEVVRYLSFLEKSGVKIPGDGFVEWRLISYESATKLAQRMWNERNSR